MSHCHGHSCCSSKSECNCSCHASHSSHTCGCQKSCGCCGSEKNKGCGCGCKECGCDYAKKFLELADCAWMEVLKEKIKAHINANAQHLDELAAIISEANHERWQKKMEKKECCGSFEEKLDQFFGKSCSTHSHSQDNQNKQR